jgi:CheY-like chemotaxis protein
MSYDGPILLIDDDEDDIDLVSEVLRQEGVHNDLHHFKNGLEAIEFLLSSPRRPFLILADINMPKMGGIEMRRAISENPVLKSKSIPFVFFTTTATEQTVLQAYEMDVQGFFEKANTIKETARRLRNIVEYWKDCRHPNQ